MRCEIPNWHTSEQLRELVAMAQPHATPEKTGYMGEPKDFTNAKKENNYLQKHSQIYWLTPLITAFLTEVEAGEKKAFYDDEKERFVRKNADQIIIDKKSDTFTQLKAIKADWKAMIKRRKDEVEELEKQQAGDEKFNKFWNEGPDFSRIKIDDKKALDQTNNEIIKYGKSIRKCSDRVLMKEFADGYARDVHHALIIDQFVAIYRHLVEKELQKWKKDGSEARTCLRQWIGSAKASEVVDSLFVS